MLDSAEIRRRFPTFTPADDEVAFYEHEAGVARPDHNPHHAYMVGDHFSVLRLGTTELTASRDRVASRDSPTTWPAAPNSPL